MGQLEETKCPTNKPRCDAKIKEIEDTFHLVMIAEHFAESLVLMKHQLCWTDQDVVTFKLNTKQADKKSPLSEEARYCRSDSWDAVSQTQTPTFLIN